MIRTGILLSITSLLLEVDDLGEFQCSKTASLSVLFFCSAGLRAQNSCKGSWDDRQRLGPFRLSVFSFKKTGRGRQLMFETQPASLSAHNSSAVYVHPITFSHLSDWWCKQLEGMEHIRTEHGEGQPCFYFPRLDPKWKKKEEKKKRLEPVLEEEQRNFLWYGRGSFGRFMAFNLPQSFLEGPGVKSEDRYMGDSCQDFRGWLQFLPCFEF